MFPHATRTAVRIYDIARADGKPIKRLSIERLREVLSQRFFDSRVPPALDHNAHDEWGWCWLDDEGPVEAGELLMFGVRHWKKNPPMSLIREMIAKETSDWCTENQVESCPKSERASIKESVRERIMRRTPPSISESPIVYDVLRKRLLLFSSANGVNDAQLESSLRVLSDAYAPSSAARAVDLVATPWSFESQIQYTRPEAVLPHDPQGLFMRWLVTTALTRHWCTATYADGTVMQVRGELGEATKIHIDTTKHTVVGPGVDAMLASLTDDAVIQALTIELTLGQPDDQMERYVVNINRHANVTSVELVDAPRIKRDEWSKALGDRGARYVNALRVVRTLWYAFDAGPLADKMAELPQQGLWGFEPTAIELAWSESRGDAAPTPIEVEAAKKKPKGKGKSKPSDAAAPA